MCNVTESCATLSHFGMMGPCPIFRLPGCQPLSGCLTLHLLRSSGSNGARLYDGGGKRILTPSDQLEHVCTPTLTVLRTYHGDLRKWIPIVTIQLVLAFVIHTFHGRTFPVPTMLENISRHIYRHCLLAPVSSGTQCVLPFCTEVLKDVANDYHTMKLLTGKYCNFEIDIILADTGAQPAQPFPDKVRFDVAPGQSQVRTHIVKSALLLLQSSARDGTFGV